MPLDPLAPHMLAAVVTSLEMTVRPPPRAIAPSPLRLVRWPAPASDRYRALFVRVGAPWLWCSRLALGDAALRAILDDAAIEVYAVSDPRGIEIGLLELDFRAAATCEIAFLGLVPELTGKGFGRWLIGQALSLAWRPGIGRVWVHTCTLDHPAALGLYRKAGFAAFERAIERFADPRVAGLLPADAAPQIPLLGNRAAS